MPYQRPLEPPPEERPPPKLEERLEEEEEEEERLPELEKEDTRRGRPVSSSLQSIFRGIVLVYDVR